MAYNEELAQRIREILNDRNEPVVEKKMFGGLAFMLHDKMCCGIIKEDLMVRALDERYEELLHMNGAREMDFTGRPMKGFLYVDAVTLTTRKKLSDWVDVAVEFAYQSPANNKKK